MDDLLEWLYNLSLSGAVHEVPWIFPTLEWIHIYSMIFLITVIAALDLRLLGFAMENPPHQHLSQLSRRILPSAWIALGVNTITGAILFASKAPEYYYNPAFRIKILLVLLGILYHSLVFPMVVIPRAAKWDKTLLMPLWTKLVGGFSLLLWVGVILASRFIAFV